jgi:hypothetical protein
LKEVAMITLVPLCTMALMLGKAIDALFIPGRESVAFITPVLETGDPRYQWLNLVQAVGKGIMSADLSRVDYEVYELQ